MINYYIISNASRASNYGIGTYTCQLQACLTPCADVHISYIDMFANTQEFLKEGNKVKAYVFFRGRSILFKDQGELLLARFANDLEEYGKVEAMPKLEGKRMIVNIAPKK